MSRFLSSFFSRILPWVVLVHALTFIAFWLTNSLFYASTNDYLADMLGWRLDYVSLLIWISAFIAVWSLTRFVLSCLGQTYKLAVLFSWLYGFISLLYILFFYGSFRLLFSESPVQLVRIGHLLSYFRIIPDTVLLTGLALLAAFSLRYYLRKKNLAGVPSNWTPLILALLVYAALWSLSLIFPPDSVVRGQLPAKPMIIAHRGASMLAPENTLVAANLAAGIGVYGLETDIQISRDEEVFLLHDDSFDRTTDIKSVFPGRESEPAGNFTMAEISQFNAGMWFVEQDPFHAISHGLVTPAQVMEYQQQAVPLLADWLDIVRQNHLAFIFDLKQPSENHPYAASFFDIAFNQIRQAGIDTLVWYLVDEAQLQTLRDLAPEMKPAYGVDYQSPPAAADLKDQGYQMVNVEYGIDRSWIQQYQAANLWVNLYTVDEPWQFSRLWLLGVDSITTSNAHVMAALGQPTFSLPYSLYALIWTLVGLLGLGLIVGLIYPLVTPRPMTLPSPPTD